MIIKGRIIKGIGGLYYVAEENNIYECSARGIFRKNKITPTVGDFVEIQLLDSENKKGSIEKILPRKNEMIRPRVTNIDAALITFAAASPNINVDLLDRFLILAEYRGIEEVIICINKCDLVDESDIQYLKDIYSPMYKVIFLSTYNNIGIDEVKEAIQNKVSVFAGPSGVGKSSLINCLIPDRNAQTGEISKKIERGKHTTRQVELMTVCENTYICDSPGFTSLSFDYLKADELCNYFKEFKPYLNQCRFNDCKHIHEPDCAVKERIGLDISQERYDRFISYYNEILQRR